MLLYEPGRFRAQVSNVQNVTAVSVIDPLELSFPPGTQKLVVVAGRTLGNAGVRSKEDCFQMSRVRASACSTRLVKIAQPANPSVCYRNVFGDLRRTMGLV
jgi:hypothetical protein